MEYFKLIANTDCDNIAYCTDCLINRKESIMGMGYTSRDTIQSIIESVANKLSVNTDAKTIAESIMTIYNQTAVQYLIIDIIKIINLKHNEPVLMLVLRNMLSQTYNPTETPVIAYNFKNNICRIYQNLDLAYASRKLKASVIKRTPDKLHAQWLPIITDNNHYDNYKCSNCGVRIAWQTRNTNTPFRCPNCNAIMHSRKQKG